MNYKTFAEYWEKEWIPTSQPAVFDLAMREIAEKAWNAAYVSGEATGFTRGAMAIVNKMNQEKNEFT